MTLLTWDEVANSQDGNSRDPHFEYNLPSRTYNLSGTQFRLIWRCHKTEGYFQFEEKYSHINRNKKKQYSNRFFLFTLHWWWSFFGFVFIFPFTYFLLVCFTNTFPLLTVGIVLKFTSSFSRRYCRCNSVISRFFLCRRQTERPNDICEVS